MRSRAEENPFAAKNVSSPRQLSVGQTRQHHRCLELMHTRLRSARSQERQWNWVQWQVRDNGWTPWRLEYVRLGRARVNVVLLPDCVAHLYQPGSEPRGQRPSPGPDAKRACRVGQSGARLPGMAERLRRVLEYLGQPLDRWKIPPGEAALEISMVREDQRRKGRHMGRGQRAAVANRVAVRRLTRNDCDARCAEVEFGPATRERRHKQPACDRHGRCSLKRLRAVFRIASYLSDRSNGQDVRRAGGEQHRSGRVTGRGDDADALLFCRGDTLLDDSRTPVATESQECNVDTGLEAIVERPHEVAATRVARKPANVQFAFRRVAAYAMGLIRNGADDARALRTVAEDILRPGSSFTAAPDIDAVIDPR